MSFRWNIAWNILRLRVDSLGSRARWVIAYIFYEFAFRFGGGCLNAFICLRLSLHFESLGPFVECVCLVPPHDIT